jgi:hypothetical protein
MDRYCCAAWIAFCSWSDRVVGGTVGAGVVGGTVAAGVVAVVAAGAAVLAVVAVDLVFPHPVAMVRTAAIRPAATKVRFISAPPMK